MFDGFYLFCMRLKLEACIHELWEKLRWNSPSGRQKCVTKLKSDVDKAVCRRDEEAAAAAHAALIQREVHPRLFRKAGKK